MSGEKIAIVGAGLAGSVLAKTLHDAGAKITVFEKSGGTGGRLATRRTDFGAFNHGAQYLSAKTPAFRGLLTGLAHAGSVKEWSPHSKDREAIWHVGEPGMSSVVKPLLDGVSLHKRTRVVDVAAGVDGAALSSEDGALGTFDRVAVTVPTPQAYDLLAGYDPVFQSLATVRYAPCWTVMAVFDGAVDTPDFVRGHADSPIGWMARAFAGENTGYVVQAGADWSRDHLELEKDDAARQILDAARELFDLPDPIHLDAHRWRYSLVERPLGTAFVASRDNRVFAAGDGMLGGRAESAFESARALADHLKSVIA
ncbi:MAG: FAD-dependent oxidoreductase [Pseudomonadota bacterium]